MEKISVTKLKNLGKNKYLVTFSNDETIEALEDAVVNFRLVLKKELTLKEYEELKNSLAYYEFYKLAIKYATQGFKCSNQVQTYLQKKQCDNECSLKIIAKLKEIKLIDDELYATMKTAELVRSGYGRYYIKGKLNELGMNNSLIEECLYSIDEEEYEKALDKLIIKQTKNYSKLNPINQKNKLKKYLFSRGYENETIFRKLE